MRLTAFLSTVLPTRSKFHLEDFSLTEHDLLLTFSSIRRTANCPDCQQRSRRVHSHYSRRLSDLPLGDLPVHVQLHARRFRCLNPTCARQTFRERLETSAPRYQRRTPALRQRLVTIGLALGGQAGRRLSHTLELGVTEASGNTLLRLVRCSPLPTVEELAPDLRIVGVDNFPFRRGTRYGPILVDLEQHRVLDLLPDREADTLAIWLEKHQGAHVEVASRDRGGAYAEGAHRGAPQAQQIADCFHLLQNLGQALDRLLTREHHVLTRVADAVAVMITEAAAAEAGSTATVPDRLPDAAPPSHDDSAAALAAASLTRVERERARFERGLAAAAEGYSLRGWPDG